MRFRVPVLTVRSTLAFLSATAALGAPLAAECTLNWDREGDVSYDLRLPDGEESVECRYAVSPPDWALILDPPPELQQLGWLPDEDVYLDVHGSGVVEVEVRFESTGDLVDFPGAVQLFLFEQYTPNPQPGEGQAPAMAESFGDIVVDPSPKNYAFTINFHQARIAAQIRLMAAEPNTTTTAQELDYLWAKMDLVMTARRVRQPCWMKAWVTGDVPESSRVFHGDVAWFRTSDEKVKEGLMVGTLADADLAETFSDTPIESLDSLLDLAERLGIMSPEDRAEAEGAAERQGITSPEDRTAAEAEPEKQRQAREGADSGPETFAGRLRQEAAAGEDEDGDNFGLNLVAFDLDANPGSDAAAAAMFTSAFTLTLSGRVMDYGADADSGGARIDFHTSLVQATVGLGDRDGDRIAFGLGNLQGWFSTTGESGDFIVGFLVGELESDGKYSLDGPGSAARILKIGVVAKFAARRGAFSCTGG